MSTKEIGAIGEARVVQMCKNTGWKKVIALQNESGQGLDIIGIDQGDTFHVIEVKTARGGKIGDLKPTQKHWDVFARPILEEIVGSGTIRGQNATPEQVTAATKLLGMLDDPVQSAQARGTVVGVDLNSDQMHVSPWSRSANGPN
jgi:hypothetical protein